MKANELMVDDWVLWKGKPVQVASVSGVKYSFGHIDVTLAHCNDEKFLETHDIKSIQPIYLTPEILEKNGWKSYSHENTPIYGMIKGFEIVLAWMDYYWQLCVDGTLYRKIRIRYIHDIQHALKLCGIEKTIKL